MALNKAYERCNNLTLAVPSAPNAGKGPISGDPLLFGTGTAPNFGCAGVAETSYTPPTGVPTGFISVDFEGAFFLTVTAKSSLSPSTGKAINPFDTIYADGGTLDVPTGCTYGFTLDANTAGVKFCYALDALPSGTTGTIRIALKGSI